MTFLNNKKIKICFSGLDGSGKTTQIDLLKENLDNQKIKYKYVHLFSKNSSVVSKLHEKPFFSFLIKMIRSMKNNRLGVFIKIFSRITNVLLDSWMTWIKDKYIKTISVVIYDRYFYDVLGVIAFDFPKWERFILTFLNLIPKPDIVIIFKSNPETVVRRKGEHSLEEAQKFCNMYKKMADRLNIVMIDSDHSIENIHFEIMTRCNIMINK